MPEGEPLRVLIVRTSALGDVVHCLPTLTALRRALPSATIGWVVEEVFAPVLDGLPDLDEVVPVALRRWRRRPLAAATLRQVAAFLWRLQRFQAGVAIDLMGNHKGAILAAVSLPGRVLGPAYGHRREPSSALWIGEGYPAGGEHAQHAVDRALAAVDALGLARGAVDFAPDRLFPGAPARPDGPPGVVIVPGGGWANKIYPPTRWGRVAELVAERTGVPSRVVSGPGEEAMAREAALASRGRARALHAGSLGELASVLRGARLVLGGDTGPVHLAHALGVPVLCLMGPTDPLRSGPYGAPERALWHRLPCSFCEKRFDDARVCLLAIPPERVAARAVELLETGPA